MEKTIKLRYPTYLKEFECIGGKCKDSCCIGWDIDIDKTTFRQYYKVEDKEMKRMFQKNVHNNEYYLSPDVDYGKVKLKSGKRCAFLDEENYCIIYSRIGEKYLSNVCTSFPRITNMVDGYYEMSLDVACPEAARILLLKEEGIKFKESEETLGKHIISSDIETTSTEYSNSPIKYFKEIRDLSIKIIQNRKFDLGQRLYILGDFITTLEKELKHKYNNVPTFIKQYNINSVNDSYKKNGSSYTFQIDFFKTMLGFLNVSKEVDSLSFKEYTKQIIAGFKFDNYEYISKHSDLYTKAFEDYTENFMNNNSYIFENYLVNFMYNYMFPFNESESMFDGYIMLLVRSSFIRFYLVGRYLYNDQDNKEDIVEFIQTFSKTIEHHRTYLTDSLNHIKEHKFDNMEFAKKLL
ncbi:flagellin lysine-N-methylase [Clostridium estertheticum]|uniref:FliB family protein n=2 Tax=Clostridium estertheticum TaxID=238834 RepID=A0A1J0GCL8_9CLOT|nr:flagellin lysine-N-methylase [Clostridium estertheticum]APC39079.1 FliB family protein [Clostridium estertheticum subsp. estertheticum]MBZ9614958.1 flagellin lysine-N-methylase [Clostridium estertheticum subsp. laramiense]MPQ30313.1 FliB family protein [Clostridium estertheticum]MPQ60989.1 FliB family protein [Clostridium estertheticum]WAG74865.1 flagellin lysine-N-methylase [Clostridium estertheticum]